MESNGDGRSNEGRTTNGNGRDAAEHMRRAIRAAAGGAGSTTELQTAARELVNQLKQERARPEQMLIRIKEILADAGIQPMYTPDSEPATSANTPGSVYRNVIAWSIRYYYEGE